MADKRILVVVDPTAEAEQPAIERAAWLAARAGANLELFICDFDSEIEAGQVSTVWIPQPDAAEKLMTKHRDRLDRLAEPLRKRGIGVGVDVAWDHPVGAAILRKVEADGPWLVAKDTHHHSVLKRTVLSNTDWHLIRGCPAPLLLVKPRAIAERPRIFAAVDPLHEHAKPAELDERIYEFAHSLATVAHGELHVAHAYAIPVGIELPVDVTEEIAGQHREAMARFLEAHPVDDGNSHLLGGPVAECLCQSTTEHDADFVVMGAVSRRGFDRLFIGSTAERLLDRLHCDLVIVKQKGFDPSLPHGD